MPGGVWAIDDPRNRLPSGAEQIQQGIGGLLDHWVESREADRQERNQMAMAGATKLPGAPRQGVMDRIRSNVPSWLGGQRGALTPMQPQVRPTPGFNPQAGAPVPLGGRSIGDMLAQGGGPDVVPSREDAAMGNVPRETRPTDAPITSEQRDGTGGVGRYLADGEGSIPPVELEGRGGDRYSIDPLRGERIKMAGNRMEAGVKADAQHAEQQRSVQALVAAGMTPEEAEARVLTNTVKYDDEYGPQRPKPMSFEERTFIENLKGENRLKAIQLKGQLDRARQATALAAKSGNAQTTQRLQQAQDRLELQWERLYFDMNKEGTKEKVPTGIDRTLEESTPGGKQRIGAVEKRVEAGRGRVAEQREKVGAKVDGKGGTKKPAADRARELLKGGKTKAQVYAIMTNEGYKVKKPAQ